MTDRADLTTADRATLATIEAILGGDDPPPDADRALAAFAAGLRDSAPQADTAFRQRLRADVVAAASAAQAERAAPWWRRRLTRRQAVAAGIAAVGLGGATVAVSAVKALVRGSASGEGTSGWSLDQTGPQLLVHGKDGVRRIGPDDALFEYLIFQVQQERWQQFEQFPSQREPQAKSLVRLSNGWQFPIPAYLPAGFKWQGFSAMYDRDKDIGRLGNAGIGSGGGGGSGLPWERMPEFDPRLSAPARRRSRRSLPAPLAVSARSEPECKPHHLADRCSRANAAAIWWAFGSTNPNAHHPGVLSETR